MPFPPAYMIVNPTDLPDLSEDYTQVDKVNLTILITTSRQLSIAVKDLRKQYYFQKISENWIQIENPERATDNILHKMSNTLKQLAVVTKQIDTLIQLVFLITKHEEVSEVTILLRIYFSFNTLLLFIFNLPDLPEPGW